MKKISRRNVLKASLLGLTGGLTSMAFGQKEPTADDDFRLLTVLKGTQRNKRFENASGYHFTSKGDFIASGNDANDIVETGIERMWEQREKQEPEVDGHFVHAKLTQEIVCYLPSELTEEVLFAKFPGKNRVLIQEKREFEDFEPKILDYIMLDTPIFLPKTYGKGLVIESFRPVNTSLHTTEDLQQMLTPPDSIFYHPELVNKEKKVDGYLFTDQKFGSEYGTPDSRLTADTTIMQKVHEHTKNRFPTQMAQVALNDPLPGIGVLELEREQIQKRVQDQIQASIPPGSEKIKEGLFHIDDMSYLHDLVGRNNPLAIGAIASKAANAAVSLHASAISTYHFLNSDACREYDFNQMTRAFAGFGNYIFDQKRGEEQPFIAANNLTTHGSLMNAVVFLSLAEQRNQRIISASRRVTQTPIFTGVFNAIADKYFNA